MSPKYSLLALDIDGTLLPRSRTLSERTVQALQRVASTGATVALCTGRSALSTLSVETQLGFSVHCICCNGAVAIAPKPFISEFQSVSDRKVLFLEPIPREAVRAISETASRLTATLQHHEHGHAAVRVRVHSSEQLQAMEARRQWLGDLEYIPMDDADHFDAFALPVKMLMLSNDPVSHQALLRERVPGVTVYREATFVDCISARADKSVGVRRLCESLGMQVQQVVAFGDGWNDVEFLKEAGLGFAMANAHPEIKAIAHRVTRYTNDEEGVAHEVEEMLAQGLFGPPAGIPAIVNAEKRTMDILSQEPKL
ncbi:HAD-like domain-containing protein [Chytriomyces sp. MP71]|nr:HAD-like domain-containing protein [Chytriomyces sp. MP71]